MTFCDLSTSTHSLIGLKPSGRVQYALRSHSRTRSTPSAQPDSGRLIATVSTSPATMFFLDMVYPGCEQSSELLCLGMHTPIAALSSFFCYADSDTFVRIAAFLTRCYIVIIKTYDSFFLLTGLKFVAGLLGSEILTLSTPLKTDPRFSGPRRVSLVFALHISM